MQFLLRFHRFRRLLNSATAAFSSRIDAHTLAGPQRVFAFPQDVVSQASNYRDVKLPVGHNALMAVVCLSVCLSVCPVPDPKSRTEGHKKLKIGRKEAHDTGDA